VGTFHGVGARLLREYAARVGLGESFSILDRGDAENLLALVRHDSGLSAAKRRFPTKTAGLAIYSRAVDSRAPRRDSSPRDPRAYGITIAIVLRAAALSAESSRSFALPPLLECRLTTSARGPG
jgi:superfamily I DNA/RNA helicase